MLVPFVWRPGTISINIFGNNNKLTTNTYEYLQLLFSSLFLSSQIDSDINHIPKINNYHNINNNISRKKKSTMGNFDSKYKGELTPFLMSSQATYKFWEATIRQWGLGVSYLLVVGLHSLIFKSLDEVLARQPEAGLVNRQNPENIILHKNKEK